MQFLDRRWLTWNDGLVPRLAQEAYQQRLPSGLLDSDRLAVLADALEDAGCEDEQILNHCREQERVCKRCCGRGLVHVLPDTSLSLTAQPTADRCSYCQGKGKRTAVHARGCWIIDLLLGKS